ncbi:tRNA (guanosine(37)-N1)-methyltransferase TrmD [Candidatus Tokpelaia sp.]|uniref:tRNA (guanosine(37)-N1)-methyltransferase TrmD n=1 Tax=Candidatus Tokpelaia sp. TaxID=2233777 RepID=UPI001239C667|nr:tRNA (guanosine(37)-N1)-methyltransferase TrmD [Candidatus Tokpelaia sp.]KAA6406347.1 tRNA (guanosine(37)-N1)-methyltransferase TrmD [Candidatus Tokpelaia sp.]
MAFHAIILTLYPEIFPGSLGFSLAGKALAKGLWSYETRQIRDFAGDKHHSVDDRPAGGGAGMVMRADVLARAIDTTPADYPRFLFSPRGQVFDQRLARQMANLEQAVFICSRFEGVDERLIKARNLVELSIGDYILSGGEIAAQTVLDSVIRLLPGVMGNHDSGLLESFDNNLLEYPHYTRPQIFENEAIPPVLSGGNHAEIAAWRQRQAERVTKARRPDLFRRYQKQKKSDLGQK